MYVIMDELAEEAGPIFLANNDAVAARNCEKAIAEAPGDDYKLYYIGDYDNLKCRVFSVETQNIKLGRVVPKEPPFKIAGAL